MYLTLPLLGHSIQYDTDYNELEYLVATRETAFETKFLEKFDIELLIGQVLFRIELCR